jgi:hypothetical protein
MDSIIDGNFAGVLLDNMDFCYVKKSFLNMLRLRDGY